MVLDLHGKNLYQARLLLEAALRRADAGVYRLRVVHGYRGGQTLRQLVREDFRDHPKVLRQIYQGEGATELVLREL